jgi:hypothetical protein
MTEASVTRIVGAVYTALASVLSDDGRRHMNDTLRFAAGQPTTPPVDAHILRMIANCTERRVVQ